MTKPIPKSANKEPLYEKALSALNLESGIAYRVLDFGCGPGELLGRLAQRVSNESKLIGIDVREEFVQHAQAAYPHIEFLCHKFVDRFDFSDAEFDIVITLDTIECIPDQRALVDEIDRILKPGGTLLAVHWDWDTQLYNSDDRDLAERMARAYAEWQQPWMEAYDPRMGRKLWALFEGSGKFRGRSDAFCLIETEFEPGRYGYDNLLSLGELVEAGGLDRSAYARFHGDMTRLSRASRYFYSVVSFIYHGQKVG